MTIRQICFFEVSAHGLHEAIDACNERVSYFDLAEDDVISISVLQPHAEGGAHSKKHEGGPQVRVVMTYWRYVPVG